ncbi:N-acetylmuramoyl-L-alanine amidase [Stenotrophomonas maltophilia]|uniref:N-acetylmuramoyl-L-alanine amidase family protein n=1 Tax=Stenotrophomonas TaxID=40323 RepID=UPI000D451961|nr:N-acetylmuramoyl-L-alanine amidase [Stenotrophomonas maltophilia]MBA0226704.1 N-acetylmuramoyl-L-alanine amidase [Stenotrophomonas maltophilia]MBA0367848.1 N-acetylmuramoyl-L-alanine amidase [Stenotrophomonas maltophilia]MBA0405707.1 N-acetylmuramoyl-L-alanine amidase [Stenotrophomonas maltophilia]MCF3522969.1 N-acetylmuramoyl-L-alanine amidase [Stenotrophomonas maltophilia]PSD19786.1 N-acetylmuramoyl-L-alanine amidase [Stenotrophomonas maltophilia]
MKGLKLASAVVACGLFFVSPVWASGDQPAKVLEDPGAYAEVVALLEREVGSQLTRHLQERGELRHVSVSIRLNAKARSMVISFGPGYLPGPDRGYDELFLIPMASSLRFYAEKSGLIVNDIDFLFDGKTLEEYYPEDLAVPPQARARSTHTSALVSASHGYISLHPSREWKFQRPAPLGIQEDTLSPLFGDELQVLMEQRSGLTVHRARSRSTELHPESGKPWEHMSSRYHLKALFPERTDIWNEFPNSPESAREKEEDIRARPNYANHLGVDVMLSLHTNGSDSASLRGTEVYYHQDKPQDKALADSILCGMREIIRAQPGYRDFPIRESSTSARHGENRIGKMPSVIIETAYHSNPDDVAALQDPVFRSASMKGVEKGYRLWAAGKTCEPLVLHPIPDTNVPVQSARDIEVRYAGNPQYPLSVELSLTTCSEAGACSSSTQTFDDPMQPVVINLACNGIGTGVARWSAVLRDADGVATAPVEFSQACVRA